MGRPFARTRWVRWVWLALGLVLAGPVAAEERTVQSLGVSGIRPGDAVDGARQKAVSYGIAEAVYRVVADELPALDTEEAYDVGRRVFRGKSRDYVTRFRVLEDRGTRPKELSTLAGATHEYVVLVEAIVTVGPVRERLVRAGLLAPAGEGGVRRVELTLESVPSYAAYEAIRDLLLDRLQAQSALPVEFTAGRVVIEVVTRDTGTRLLDRLARSGTAEFRVEPVDAGDREARGVVRAVRPEARRN